MSIKAKLIILTSFSLAVTAMIGFVLIQNTTTARKEVAKQTIVTEILNRLFERAVLRDEYLLYRGERPITQLQLESGAIEKLLIQSSSILTSTDEQASVNRLGHNNKFADQTLSQIIANSKNQVSNPSAGSAGSLQASTNELEQRLISQLLIKSQESIAIASQLSNSSRSRVIESQNRTTLFVEIFFASSTIIILVVLYFIWLSIAKPLIKLKEAALRIAALDFTTTTTTTTGKNSNDEIGQLARAFNMMIEKLKESYGILEQKIHDRTQDLEKFKLAVDNTSEQVVITDPEGIVVYANQAVEKITGYKPEETVGKKSGVLWKSPMPLPYYQKMWDTIKKQKKVFTSEIQNKRKNGEVYTAIINISPILDEKGEIEFFVGIERDITREKEVDKAKTEFVSLASHQLRTPLSTVNWYTEMLLDGSVGKLNTQQKKYLEEVYRGNHRMVDLVNSLLNVSRLELGTFSIEPKPCDVIKLVKEVVEGERPEIKKRKLVLKETYAVDLPKINADPKLLHMVFDNLLSNAVKYTPEGGKVTIEIQFNRHPEHSEGSHTKTILIKVSDTGYGIPKNQQDKIFTKLFRADNVREKNTEGTGLGLYIVKSIMDHSDGKIWFESEENKGSTFYVALPLSGMKKKEGTKQLT